MKSVSPLVFVCIGAALLAACSKSKELSAFSCPAPIIVANADRWPASATPNDPSFDILIRAIDTQCSALPGREIESSVTIGGYMRAYQPGGAPATDFSVDIFAAIVDPNDQIITQHVETVEIDGISASADALFSNFSHEFKPLSFMVGEGLKSSNYRLTVGFRLSQEQLAANRAGRFARLSPAPMPAKK